MRKGIELFKCDRFFTTIKNKDGIHIRKVKKKFFFNKFSKYKILENNMKKL